MEYLFNPLSLKERTFLTALAVIGRDGKVYSIQEGYTAFRATEPTTISGVEVTADVTTV